MALISCPECNQKISDTSDKCIHCGYVLGKSRKIVEVSGISLNKNNKRYLFISFCIILNRDSFTLSNVGLVFLLSRAINFLPLEFQLINLMKNLFYIYIFYLFFFICQ